MNDDCHDCIRAGVPCGAHTEFRAAPSPALTREALYQAIRPEFRTEGPGGDKGWADARAAEITDRIFDRLSALGTPPPSSTREET